MIPGKCTRPLRLPKKAPACFRTQRLWDDYRAGANYSAGDGFTFCTDCTQSRHDEMVAAGRCEYPKTEFVKTPSGNVVGRRNHHSKSCAKGPARSTKPKTVTPPSAGWLRAALKAPAPTACGTFGISLKTCIRGLATILRSPAPQLAEDNVTLNHRVKRRPH